MINFFDYWYREFQCFWFGHKWVRWGRTHCDRCGKIDWYDEDKQGK